MVFDKQKFSYQQRVIIERMTLRAPYQMEVLLKKQGCFLFFKKAGFKLIASHNEISIQKEEALLLNRGSFLFDFPNGKNEERMEVFAIYLYPDIVWGLYQNDIAALKNKYGCTQKTQLITSNKLISKFIESLEFYFQQKCLACNDLITLKIRELILILE